MFVTILVFTRFSNVSKKNLDSLADQATSGKLEIKFHCQKNLADWKLLQFCSSKSSKNICNYVLKKVTALKLIIIWISTNKKAVFWNFDWVLRADMTKRLGSSLSFLM